jgi:hypothetical protein
LKYFSLLIYFIIVLIFLFYYSSSEIMIGGPQPSGGMEGLKTQLKGNPDSAAADPNGTTDQATEGDAGDAGN